MSLTRDAPTTIAPSSHRTVCKAPKRGCSAPSMMMTAWWMSRARDAPTTVAPSDRRTAKEGTKTAEFCAEHREDGMVDVNYKRCAHHGCIKRTSYGKEGTKTAEFCAEHREDGMLHVVNKRCAHPSCTTLPSYGVEGARTAEFCVSHARDEMADVRHQERFPHRRCAAVANNESFSGRQAESQTSMDDEGRSRRGGRSSAGVAGAVRRRGDSRPPPTQAGSSSGRGVEGSKRLRENLVDAPSSMASTEETVAATLRGAPLVAVRSTSSEPDTAVKTEAQGGSCARWTPRGLQVCVCV